MLDKDANDRRVMDIARGDFEGREVEFAARRLVVQLESVADRSPEDAVSEVLDQLGEGARVLRGPSATGRLIVLIPDRESALDATDRVATVSGVRYAEPDVVDHAQIVPDDTRYVGQYAPSVVRAEEAWNLETGTSAVVMGIIDSGISMTGTALDHDDLNDAGRIHLGTDFVDGGPPRDLNGHGTHVAGIAGASGNNATGVAGLNWGSPLYICRTLDVNGDGTSADFADAVEEITDWATANGLRAVINYSGGGPHNRTKQDACRYASDRGMLVVAAAGNDYGGAVIWPAAYSLTIAGVVAVGSTDAEDKVSDFSNVGPEITVVAPGDVILATTPPYAVTLSARPAFTPNYGILDGTSMATPLVTGLAALMWSRHPSYTNTRIKECLQSTAVPLGAGDFDNSWGHGRVDALKAVRCGDPIFLPSRLVACPSRVASCPSLVTVCVTRLGTCPSLVTECPSTLSACATRVTRCPTVLRCPSVVTACFPSRLPQLCPVPSRAVCPPEVELPPFPAGPDVLAPIPGSGQPRGLRDKLSNALGDQGAVPDPGSEDLGGPEGPGAWFYVDDDGRVRLL